MARCLKDGHHERAEGKRVPVLRHQILRDHRERIPAALMRPLRVDVCLIPPALCHHEARLRGDFLQALHSAAVVKVTVGHKDHLEIRGVHAARLDIREELIHKRLMHRVNQHRTRRRLDEPRGHPIHAHVIDAVKRLIGVDLLSLRV